MITNGLLFLFCRSRFRFKAVKENFRVENCGNEEEERKWFYAVLLKFVR
jgi:hypothetical protein